MGCPSIAFTQLTFFPLISGPDVFLLVLRLAHLILAWVQTVYLLRSLVGISMCDTLHANWALVLTRQLSIVFEAGTNAIWCLWKYLTHVKHDYTFFKACCHHSSIMWPIDVKNRLAIWINITCIVCFWVWIVEASNLLVISERPNIDIWVLTTHCKKWVIWTQGQASNICCML